MEGGGEEVGEKAREEAMKKIGLGEAERSRYIVYKDMGMIDNPDQLEAVEIQGASHKQNR